MSVDASAHFTWPFTSVRTVVSTLPSATSRIPGSSVAVTSRSHVSRYATMRVLLASAASCASSLGNPALSG